MKYITKDKGQSTKKVNICTMPYALCASMGFTLIEALIAIAIISVLSAIGVNNMIAFQKDARLESFASEFESTLKTAKNKSVNAEVLSGVSVEDTDTPTWGVKVDSDKYSLMFEYMSSGTSISTDIETYPVVSGNSILPIMQTNFERLTGKTTPTCFSLQVSGYSKELKVYVDSNGNVSDICP
jgi:prepilin-type N-terminal cleavage/methylation domain-containing protein